MSKKILFGSFFVVAFFLMTACSGTKSLKKTMTSNAWQTVYLKIVMPTFNGEDLHIYEDNFDKEESVAAQSVYKRDGTFRAWYLMPNGEKKDETTGKWDAKGDSLFVKYLYRGKLVEAVYKVSSTAQGFDAISVRDWDYDGEDDDTLRMKSKKIKW